MSHLCRRVPCAVASLAVLSCLSAACSSANVSDTRNDVGTDLDVASDALTDAADTRENDAELADVADTPDADGSSDVGDTSDTRSDVDADAVTDVSEGSGAIIRVVTFNTGTGIELGHNSGPDDGYGSEQAALTDQWYGNGLAWSDFVDDTRAFFAAIDADIVVFQEVFWSGDCPNIPEEARTGYVCETWVDGDPTVAQQVLGDDWQVICHPGKPDKCLAVNTDFGSFRGCDTDFCLEGADGFRVETCGSGSRIGRGVIERADGGTPITVVNVHGSSGFNASDSECRRRQFEQVFVDLGDGEPGANGELNLVLGDFNTDPVRLNPQDSSAARLAEFVGDGLAFEFVSAVGRDATPTYAGLFNIDHVVSDELVGQCSTAGIEEAWPAPTEAVVFDHRPLVCDLQVRRR
jgi:hypothetical protein